jgi:uridine phosphorylase
VDRIGAMDLLGLSEEEVPRLLVLEGTWWRQEALDRRLPLLDDPHELGVPDLWHGWAGDLPVVYACVYGAQRAAEVVHLLGLCGTPVVAHLAAAFALTPTLQIGDIVLPESTAIGEGVSQYYGAAGVAPANMGKVARAAALLAPQDVYPHRGSTVTTEALLAMPEKLLASWQKAGHLAVDLEGSAVFSAASAFRMRAVSLLHVWDHLPRRPWTEPFTDEQEAAQDRARQQVWSIALQLA